MPMRTARRQWRRRHQRLDQPRHQQHTDQPDGHRHHRSALFGEHLPTRPVARRHHRPAQPHPGRAGQEHGRQFEQPVRGEQTQEDVGLARIEHQRRDHPEVECVLEQQPRDRYAEQDREADALDRDPRIVHPHLQRERPGGVLAVVGREVVVDQFVYLAWGFEARLHLGVARHPQGDQRRPRRRTPRPCRATTASPDRRPPGTTPSRTGRTHSTAAHGRRSPPNAPPPPAPTTGR